MPAFGLLRFVVSSGSGGFEPQSRDEHVGDGDDEHKYYRQKVDALRGDVIYCVIRVDIIVNGVLGEKCSSASTSPSFGTVVVVHDVVGAVVVGRCDGGGG